MTQDFGIESKYIPQQWVTRNNVEPDVNEEKASGGFAKKIGDSVNQCFRKIKVSSVAYYIDRKKLQNHFSLIMQLPQKIETPEELAVANVELILFSGWYLVDTFTVLAHILTILILAVPLLLFTLIQKTQYSIYSLLPAYHLITM